MRARRFLLFLLVGLLAQPAVAAEELPVLTQIGPWPTLSRLVAYQDRIWFANSVKGRNHNSADLYSLDPSSGEVRYERHLFSQDAGHPIVSNGLLYWPFEDSRFSLGWGHYMVTDGEKWRTGTIPGLVAFHTHAMTDVGGRLVAATSAWRAGIQVSQDQGQSWKVIYDHATTDRRVSRIVSLEGVGSRTFGYLIDRSTTPARRTLLQIEPEAVRPVPGWPEARSIAGMTSWQDWLYAALPGDDGAEIWRTDGTRSQNLGFPFPTGGLRDLTSDARGLWAVTAEEAGSGRVWHSRDGKSWAARYDLRGGRPGNLLVTSDGIYVAGSGSEGRGVLWGQSVALRHGKGIAVGLPPRPTTATDLDWDIVGGDADRLLAAEDSYRRHGRPLRDLFFQVATNNPPKSWFSQRLSQLMPTYDLSLIGGAVEVPAAELGRWIVLWAMSLAEAGAVPEDLLSRSWDRPENPSEKYFHPTPAAAWAAASIGQSDPETLARLVDRLDEANDPLWLRGDIVGALTALTDQRFGYDVQAWRDWWREAATE